MINDLRIMAEAQIKRYGGNVEKTTNGLLRLEAEFLCIAVARIVLITEFWWAITILKRGV